MFSAMTYGGNAHAQVSLVSSEQLLRYVTGSSKLLVPGRVSAANSIPQGAMSIPIAPSQLRGQPDIVQVCSFSYLVLRISKLKLIFRKDICKFLSV